MKNTNKVFILLGGIFLGLILSAFLFFPPQPVQSARLPQDNGYPSDSGTANTPIPGDSGEGYPELPSTLPTSTQPAQGGQPTAPILPTEPGAFPTAEGAVASPTAQGTQGINTLLTEEAEMNQSKVTPLPGSIQETEALTPTAEATAALTATPEAKNEGLLSKPISIVRGFRIDWLFFAFGMILSLGGGSGAWYVLATQNSKKAAPLLLSDTEPSPFEPETQSSAPDQEKPDGSQEPQIIEGHEVERPEPSAENPSAGAGNEWQSSFEPDDSSPQPPDTPEN